MKSPVSEPRNKGTECKAYVGYGFVRFHDQDRQCVIPFLRVVLRAREHVRSGERTHDQRLSAYVAHAATL